MKAHQVSRPKITVRSYYDEETKKRKWWVGRRTGFTNLPIGWPNSRKFNNWPEALHAANRVAKEGLLEGADKKRIVNKGRTIANRINNRKDLKPFHEYNCEARSRGETLYIRVALTAREMRELKDLY